MQFQFSFKHMETSQALQEYAQEKIGSLVDKFVHKPIEVHVTFLVDKHKQQALCTLTGGDGFTVNVEHSCDDMYGSIDRMLDKLAVQLKRKKDKLKHHKFKESIKNMPLAGEKSEDDFAVDAVDIIKYEMARRKRVV
ncbi:MAG: ribosome hibernation-promoting factor, HPF/YfiA family [Oligoflexus sp.]